MCLDILLQQGSIFCICRRASSLSAIKDFSAGSVTSETSGVICHVGVFGERYCQFLLPVLYAGQSGFVTPGMLIGTDVWSGCTRHERQSVALL